jgi:antitoxin ParD1/3/4
MNISLPDTMRSQIEKEIEVSGYGNNSEFFRDAVRDLLKKRREERLEALLLEGLDSGDPTRMTNEILENIRTRGLKRIQKQKAQK